MVTLQLAVPQREAVRQHPRVVPVPPVVEVDEPHVRAIYLGDLLALVNDLAGEVISGSVSDLLDILDIYIGYIYWIYWIYILVYIYTSVYILVYIYIYIYYI